MKRCSRRNLRYDLDLFLSTHPMLTVDFMRQEIALPLKRGRKLVQRLKNASVYCREIIYTNRERIKYETN